MSDLTLALDAMGGDHGPHVTVPAALQALKLYNNLNFILVGDQSILSDLLHQHKAQESTRLQLLHADDVVPMSERPTQAVRGRRQSSMRLALELVKSGQADGCVSAGNTGALMAMSKVLLRTLPGIERPALVAPLPTFSSQRVYALDLGANVSCDSDTLLQFAVMGSVLAERVGQVERPRIALLNIGTESIKGNDQVQQAARLLQAVPELNYCGFVEGDEIYTGKADVIVCDGFIGNVTLKTSEGIAKLLLEQLRKSLKSSWLARALAWALKGRLQQLNRQMNPDQYNGASLIGLRGIVVKSHGNADENAFLQAIDAARVAVQTQVPERIKDRLESVLLDKS